MNFLAELNEIKGMSFNICDDEASEIVGFRQSENELDRFANAKEREMSETLTIEVPGEDVQKDMRETMAPYRKYINETPALTSLLYDIDLLPEQIRLPVNVGRMIAVCELFKRVPPEAIAEMMTA